LEPVGCEIAENLIREVPSAFLILFDFFDDLRADALFSRLTPFQASQVQLRVWNPFPAALAPPSDIVFEKLDRRATGRAADFENVSWFPVARVLTRTFHTQYYTFPLRLFQDDSGEVME